MNEGGRAVMMDGGPATFGAAWEMEVGWPSRAVLRKKALKAPRYIAWIWTPEVHLIGPRCPYRHDTQWSDEEGRHDVRQSRSVQDGVGTRGPVESDADRFQPR